MPILKWNQFPTFENISLLNSSEISQYINPVKINHSLNRWRLTYYVLYQLNRHISSCEESDTHPADTSPVQYILYDTTS